MSKASDNWQILIGGRWSRAYPIDELADLVRQGIVTEGTQVRSAGSEESEPATCISALWRRVPETLSDVSENAGQTEVVNSAEADVQNQDEPVSRSVDIRISLLGAGFILALVFSVSWGERIVAVTDLPDSRQYMNADGELMNLGLCVHQVTAWFIIPVWNYGLSSFVLVPANGEARYHKLLMSQQDLNLLAFSAGTRLPEMGFWHKWGGKITFFSSLVLMVIGCRAVSRLPCTTITLEN